MTSADEAQRYERLFEAFERGRSLPESELESWLAALAARDADLAREVRRLLERREAADEDPLADGTIEARRPLVPWVAVEHASAADEALPEHIGLFRVLRRLGAGGMGVVYEAEQEAPRRRVAVKLVRPGLAFGERLRRFRLEAEALGRLKHPGIAQIFELGTCDLGHGEQPYFVMELVEGQPLLMHAAEAGLERAARLALVSELCDAVQHAHERGIVHRDLKPDNVLVDASGRARVLDFGVARVRADDVPLTTIHTAQGEIVGTLTHMAPEQLAGDPSAVGPAVDVYALGVIAFELLTGRLPHEVAGLSLTQAARHITEVDAPRLGTLDRGLRGDLETIVAKALDADPARRYVTPAALASDLRRYLASEPIAARPAGLAYRASKYTRRHPGLVGGSAFAALSLTTGLIVAWNFALDARAGRRAAEAASYRHVLNSVAGTLDQPASDVERALLLEAPAALRGWEWEYLRARTADPSVEIVSGSIDALAIAEIAGVPLVAVTGYLPERGHFLEVLDLERDRNVFRLEFPARRRGLDVALNEAGELTVIEHGGDREVVARRFQLPGGEETLTRVLEGAEDRCQLSGDGHHASSASNGKNRGILYDLDHGGVRELSTFELGLSHTGDLMALKDFDGDMTLIEATTGAELLRLPQAEAHFDPSSGRLVTISGDFQLRVWDTRARPVRELFSTTIDTDVRRVSVAAGDRSVAIADRSFTITVYSMDGSETARKLGKTGSGVFLRWWPDGKRLALWSPAGSRSWDTTLSADEVLTAHASYVYDLAASPELGLVVSAGWDGWAGQPGCLRLLDLESGAEVLRLGGEREITEWASWLPGTESLVFSIRERGVPGVAPKHVEAICRFDVVRGAPVWEIDRLGRAQAVTCSPDGTRVAVAVNQGEVRLLDAADGHELWRWGSADINLHCERSLAWSPDGTLLAACELRPEYSLVLLDSRTGEERLPCVDAHARNAHIRTLAFSPDGNTLASVFDDHSVRLWDPRTGLAVGAAFPHDSPVLALAFHPDGTRLATGTRDGLVRIWNVATGEALLRLPGHTAYVHALVWIDDGRTLLSASGDGTVRRWSSRTAGELAAARREHARLADALRPRVEAFLTGGPTPEATTAWLATSAESAREREVARQLVMAKVHAARDEE